VSERDRNRHYYLDGTFGGGGHTRALLAASAPDGIVLAIDADPAAAGRAAALRAEPGVGERFRFVPGNFRDLAAIARAEGVVPLDGVLLDLGLSSFQLDSPERGFAFRFDGPLDMRFDPARGESAADLVARLPEEELAGLIWRLGEEPSSRRIARALVREREREPIATTGRLAAVVEARSAAAAAATPTPRPGPSRRCGSPSTTNSRRSTKPSPARWTSWRRAGGWPSSRSTRWRTGSSRRSSPEKAPSASARPDCPSAPAATGPGWRRSPARRSGRRRPRSPPTPAAGAPSSASPRGSAIADRSTTERRSRRRSPITYRPAPIRSNKEMPLTAFHPLDLPNVLVGTGGRLVGVLSSDTLFRAVERDARAVQPGDLFVAIEGERFDGHAFVADAAANGAAAALVRRSWASEHGPTSLPLVVVPDEPVGALQRLARWWRERLPLTVVGITGSVGKTSVKEVAGAILARRFVVYKSPRQPEQRDRAAALPAGDDPRNGGRRAGDGRRLRLRRSALLASIAHPKVGLVLNIHPVHLERMGTIEAIAGNEGGVGRRPSGRRDRGPQRRRFPGPGDGSSQPGRVLFFGLGPDNDVRATAVVDRGIDGVAFTLRIGDRAWPVETPMVGAHAPMVALAGLATGHALGLAPDEMIPALADREIQIRVRFLPGPGGSRLIDDTYNASPPSVLSALGVLAASTGATGGSPGRHARTRRPVRAGAPGGWTAGRGDRGSRGHPG
jgi:UDP-N-acetylmuramyl pentapeptide synthase